MKRTIITTIVLLSMACSYAMTAQTTSWPYLYPQFQDGVIYMTGGQKIYQSLNVHLLKGRLHYIDNGVVKEAKASDIFYAEIGSDKFMVVSGDMMRVEAESPTGFVACRITGDFDALMTGTGAYGMTAHTEAIPQYSSLNVQQGVNMNHMLLLQNKNEGQPFNLKQEYFIVAGSKIWRAVRSDIEKSLSKEERKSFRAFAKEHGVRWKDPKSLIFLTEFLANREN